MNIDKALKLNSVTFFGEKEIPLEVKEFHELHEDLKIM